jgi:RING-box protein 2
MEDENIDDLSESGKDYVKSGERMFTLKKWNAVAMWSWDVECDTCAICRVQVMGRHIKGVMLCHIGYL